MIGTLVLCGDYWHPASLIQKALRPLEHFEFQFTWLESEVRADQISDFPLTILAKSEHPAESGLAPWMTPAVEAVLADYVRAGNGLLAIHSGTAGYEQARVLRSLLGGVFSRHPEQCAVTVQPHAGHALCAGSTPFTQKDEHYFGETMCRACAAGAYYYIQEAGDGPVICEWNKVGG